MKRNLYIKGISVVEVLIVLSILAVLIAVVMPQFSRSRETQTLSAAAGDILSALSRAQAQTLASVDSSSYGVRFEANAVIIFKGSNYSAGNADNESISIVSPAAITNVTLAGTSGTSGSLYFNRLSGAPSKSGTVTISTPSFSKTITITATGSASVD